MPSSTRWRINVTVSNHSNYLGIVELAMAATVGGANLCTGGTASASTEYPGPYTAAMAFDGNAGTYWSTTNTFGVGWLQYEFASAVSIVSYRVQGENSNGTAPKDWTFQYWDGSAWQTVHTVTNQTGWSIGEVRSFSVDSGVAAAARVSQLVAETLSHPTPAARVTQLVVETLSSLTGAAAPDARLSQLVVETLTLSSRDVYVTQLVAETLTSTPVPPSLGRISQLPLEILDQYPTAARISQAPVEIVDQYPTAAFISQSPLETLHQHAAPITGAAVSQAPLEIIYPFGCYVYQPPVWCPVAFPIDSGSPGLEDS